MELNEDPELVFENDIYVITVKAFSGEVLRVEAEQKSDGALWRGDFTSGYIEDITRRTGNSKKFSVFVKMLRSAILQDSDCVFVSLLTYYELEVLKSRKSNPSQVPRDMTNNNKRYLILTYVGEFDRVHYPLPLLYEDSAEPESLRRTIQRLKNEMSELKERLSVKMDPKSRNNFSDANNDFRLDFAEEAHMHGNCNEKRFEAEKAHLIKEILSWKSKHKLLLAKYEAKKECYKELQTWRKKCEKLQEDLKKERNNHKRSVGNLLVEKMGLIEEMKQYRDGEARTRVRLRESESQLDHIKRRMRVTNTRELPPSRTQTRPATSRRPSPQTKGVRSSSCPTFRPRPSTYREQGTRHAACIDPLLPRISQKYGRRSPQPFANLSGRSSCSERSATPLVISPRSCGASPVKTWRGIPAVSNDTDKRIRKERLRDESPGKLLKDVKDKLAKFAMLQRLDRSEVSSVMTTSSMFEDNHVNISNRQTLADDCTLDIEARIEALQNFLQSKA